MSKQCINPACTSHMGAQRVVYARGLCKACYMRESRAGSLHRWTLTGQNIGPQCPPARVNLDTLLPAEPTTWEGAWVNKEWRDTVAYEVRRTAEWLEARGRAAA